MRVRILVKELRDICCEMDLGCVWGVGRYMEGVCLLQRDGVLDRMCKQYLYEILLNMSAVV